MSDILNQADKLGGKIIEKLPTVASDAATQIGNISKETLETVKKIGTEVGQHTQVAAEQLLQFVEKEGPNLLWEIIGMARVQAGMRLAICSVILLIFAKTFYSKHKVIWTYEFKNGTHMFGGLLSYLLSGGIVLYTCSMFYLHINEWVLPFVAPRLYMLNYMKDLVVQLRG